MTLVKLVICLRYRNKIIIIIIITQKNTNLPYDPTHTNLKYTQTKSHAYTPTQSQQESPPTHNSRIHTYTTHTQVCELIFRHLDTHSHTRHYTCI